MHIDLLSKTLAKFDPDISIVDHSLNAAACAEILLKTYYFSALHTLSQNLGLPIEDTLKFTVYLASLHDIGKIHPLFQGNYYAYENFSEQRKAELHDLFKTDRSTITDFRHEKHSEEAAKRIWQDLGFMDRRLRRLFSAVLGFHHEGNNRKETEIIIPAQRKLYYELQTEFEQQMRSYFNVTFPSACQNHNIAGELIRGIIILADWIASSGVFDQIKTDNIFDHYHDAVAVAEENIRAIGLVRNQIKPVKEISDLYPFITEPHPMQKLVSEISLEDKPGIIIMEDLPGAGKTEAGIMLAFRLKQIYEKAGVAMFLPTGATSNQSYMRMAEMLSTVDNSIIRLVHGMAWTVEDANILTSSSKTELGESFLKSSRESLLHPYVVGTVDQLEMAAMNKKYAVLRMLGLTEKVVIIDEIHAYDAYMRSILVTLVKWMSELDIPVIMLSATLTKKAKSTYLEAAGVKISGTLSDNYPLLTIGSRTAGVSEYACKSHTDKQYTIKTEKGMSDPEAIAKLAVQKVKNGGNIAVFLNSVKLAQYVYDALISTGYKGILTLYHARYTVSDRKKKDDAALAMYSKKAKRPESSIIICTQVCEQSLDVSFDYLITELCPIDLLIQRLGRLLRFEHVSPKWVNKACPEVSVVTGTYGASKYGPSKYVYPEYFLMETEKYIKDHPVLKLPQMLRECIETVYREDLSDEKYIEIVFGDNVKQAAAKRIVKTDPLTPGYYLAEMDSQIFSDDISNSNEEALSTRFDSSSVRIILGTNGEYDAYVSMMNDRCREYSESRKIIERMITIRVPSDEIEESDRVKMFEKGHLAGCYYLLPDSTGNYSFCNKLLTYSFEKGLVVE